MNKKAMNRIVILLSAAVLTVAVTPAAERPFPEIMKAAYAANGGVKKAMTDKDNAKISTEAIKLKAEFKAMEKYWAKHGKADAAGWSKMASMEAGNIVKALKKNDSAKADAALKAVGGTCKTCHEAYREKGADGKFLNKIKG